ncbi:TIGR02270 family protein [Agaribacterium haliotis]|uniref:TIGR02270 family protein n=1 Tax=Agaribacterium haliotis TaxID=2013869 RepID=UPI00117797A4|nr:TIGR02270 family protein [Agaribacterium haliotis]
MSLAVSAEHPFYSMYERYVDDAAFLWLLRQLAQKQPHYDVPALVELEQRLNRQIEAILSDAELAWLACEALLEHRDAGEFFVAAVVALRTAGEERFDALIELAGGDETLEFALASACAWLHQALAKPVVERLFKRPEAGFRRIALHVCRLKSWSPLAALNAVLTDADARADDKLYCLALRCVGEFKAQALKALLLVALQDERNAVQFEAIAASILLGQYSLAEKLRPWVFAEQYHERAVNLAFCSLPAELARQWVAELAKMDNCQSALIQAIACLGDPQAVPWLLAQMRDALWSRRSGLVFSSITGIDLEQHELVNDIPDLDDSFGDEHQPLQFDDDESLPFPDADKVAALWQKYGRNFVSGKRYMVGRQLSSESLQQLWQQGPAYLRARAALLLALQNPSQPLLNACAPIA